MRETPDDLRLGIVGTGMIAGVMAAAAGDAAGVSLAAVSSREMEKAKDFAEEHGADQPFDSWKEMCESDGVDAVYVATPSAVAEEIVVAAAECGKHVLADKPFVDLPTLRRMVEACRENDVAFMDATHFVHHPRTVQAKNAVLSELGGAFAQRSTFFFPLDDRQDIRMNPELEPLGAVGDVGWYPMRATVEFLDPDAGLEHAAARITWDEETGASIRVAGHLVFDDGTTSTFDAGFDVGTCLMDLDVLGPQGELHMDDYVLDWKKGFAFEDTESESDPVFVLRKGMVTPKDFETVVVPSAKPQQALMLESFAALARSDKLEVDNEPWIRASERTQELLDAVWEAGRRG